MSSSSKPSTNCVFVDVSTKIVGEENYPNYCLLQTCKMFHAIQTTPELAKWSEHCMSVAPWVAHYQFVAIADSTVCIFIPNSYITPYPCCHTWSNRTYTYQMFSWFSISCCSYANSIVKMILLKHKSLRLYIQQVQQLEPLLEQYSVWYLWWCVLE